MNALHATVVAGQPPAPDRRLIPILARVLDLGRGPQGLVRWVQERVGRDPVRAPRTTVLNRLAGELAVEIRGGGWAGTVLDYRGVQPG